MRMYSLPIDVTLIANLVLVAMIAIVVIASLIGLWKGIWKTSFKLIFRSALFLVMVFLAQPITRAICSINFKESFGLTLDIGGAPLTTIDATIAQLLANSGKISPIDGQSLYVTCLSLGHSLASYAIFFAVMILTLLFGSLLSTIFYHILFKFFISKKLRKKKKIRWAGALCGLLDGALCLLMFFSPLSSIASLAADNISRVDQAHESQLLDDEKYEALKAGLEGYKNSALFGTLEFLTPLSDGIMDKVVEVEIDGVKVGLVTELGALLDILDPLLGVIQAGDDGIIVDYPGLLAKDTVHSLVEMICSSKLIINLIPGLITMGEAMIDDPSLGNAFAQLDFSDVDWSDDLRAVDAFYGKVYDTGLLDDFEPDGKNLNLDLAKVAQYQDALRSITSIKAISDNLSSLMVYVASTVNSIFKAKVFSTDINDYSDLDWTHEVNCFADTFGNLLTGLNITSFDGFDFDKAFNAAISDSARMAKVKAAIVGSENPDGTTDLGMMDLDMIQSAVDLDGLAGALAGSIEELNNYLDPALIDGIFDDPNLDLKKEFSAIIDVIPIVINNPLLPLDSALDLADDVQIRELKRLISTGSRSSFMMTLMPSLIQSSLADSNFTSDMMFGLSIDDLNFYFESGSEFEREMNNLLDMASSAISISSAMSDPTLSTSEKLEKIDLGVLKDILTSMYKSKIVNPDHRIDGSSIREADRNFIALIKGVLSQDALKSAGIVVPDRLDNIAWLDRENTEGEISKLIAAMQIIKDNSAFFLDENVEISKLDGETIEEILGKLGDSEVLSHSLPSIFNAQIAPTLEKLGVKLDFSVVSDWAHEGKCLGRVIDSLNVISKTDNLADIDWLSSDPDRVNAILTAFSETDIMAVRQDETGRYVDYFGELLATVFTGDSFKDVLGASIDSSYFQSANPQTGEFDRGWRYVVTTEDKELPKTVDGVVTKDLATLTATGEIASLVEVLKELKAAGIDNISSGNLDPASLEAILNSVVATNTLRPVIPDLLNSSLRSVPAVQLDADNAVNIGDLNTSIFLRMEKEELNTEIHNLVKIYSEFTSGELESIFQSVSSLTSPQLDTLQDLLDTMASLKSFTTPKTGRIVPLYEEIVSAFLNYSTLDQMITNRVGDKAKAKAEMSSIISGVGRWVDSGTGVELRKGENTLLVDFLRQLQGIDLADLNSFTSLKPEQIEKFMAYLNPSALLHQAIPTFFEQAFGAFKIGDLTAVEGTVYYPVDYRVHLTTADEDISFWNSEIATLVGLSRSLYDPESGRYFDASSFGFSSGEIALYDLLQPIDQLKLLSNNKEYIVYSLIKNTDVAGSSVSLTSLVRDLDIEGENSKAARIRKLFFPIGHSDEDLRLQCEILEGFLSDMSSNIGASFSKDSGEALSGDLAYRFVMSTMQLDYSGETSDVSATRSLFASELVASYLTQGFKAVAASDPDILAFFDDFFFARDARGYEYKNLNIVEARGIKGLFDLARARTKADIVSAIKLLGLRASTIDSLVPDSAETALLKETHRRDYQGATASSNNSAIALKLFKSYAPASISSLMDITKDDFVFEDLADAIEKLNL